MAAKRKIVPVLIYLSVPATMSAAAARLEARTLINDQSNYYADPGDVRVRKIRAMPKELR